MFEIFRKKKKFFNEDEKSRIVEAIHLAEHRTSGEVRVFVESRCSYVDAIDRAAEIFSILKMHNTADKNGVLVYVAVKDHQLAVFGDEGIHKKLGNEYWNKEVEQMIPHFNKNNYSEGIRQCILDIGEALQKHFPYNKDTDKNELPDDIVFGR
ncbi:MAG: TPM domain-containing protein [Bacteroidia bacterium]|nr:TPM domain-containing protein [Bacteroidia bacterium]